MELTTVHPSGSTPAVSATPASSSSHDINSLFAAAVAAAAANSTNNPESMAQSPAGMYLGMTLIIDALPKNLDFDDYAVRM